MQGNRKKLYIAIIIICFAATGGIIYYGFFGNNPTSPSDTPISHPLNNNPVGQNSQPTSGNPQAGAGYYSAPTVFPQDTKFDWTLVNSAEFKALHQIPPLEVGPVGRPNPFQ
jgi:hypothetical protein